MIAAAIGRSANGRPRSALSRAKSLVVDDDALPLDVTAYDGD
jgi:hypothetical protein